MDITRNKELPSFFSENDLCIARLSEYCQRQVSLPDYPYAHAVEQNILIYQGDMLRNALDYSSREVELANELCHCLRDGPGVFVIKNAYEDLSCLDRMTELFHRLIRQELVQGQGEGDHFGSNERIWNSIQKTCVSDPDLCVDYYGNPLVALAARAWLGSGYQITAQVNNVKPGGEAQSMHRDYHLGFQSQEVCKQFPAHAHMASQYLTLQGAVAHTDMSLASGPTMLLPFSHHFPAGYLAYSLPEFVDYFQTNRSQLALNRGDVIFFSPAIFHAAGENRTQEDRLANLLQISSGFGRAMEEVDRNQMMKCIHPHLVRRLEANEIQHRKLVDVIAAFAEGYSFPTNLDSDPPIGGCAPETNQKLWLRALEERWTSSRLVKAVAKNKTKRQASAGQPEPFGI